MTFMCLLLYGRHLSDKNIAENEAMIYSAAWWKQWISPRFKSSFLVLFCFLYGVTYKPSRAGQNCYTWCCYSQWMYLQVTIIKIYLSIYLSPTHPQKNKINTYMHMFCLLLCFVAVRYQSNLPVSFRVTLPSPVQSYQWSNLEEYG